MAVRNGFTTWQPFQTSSGSRSRPVIACGGAIPVDHFAKAVVSFEKLLLLQQQYVRLSWVTIKVSYYYP